MATAAIFAVLTLKNSVGNVIEIFDLLDKQTHTGEQLAENYRMLIEKWGEWHVIGGDASMYDVSFIDLRKAMFGGLMMTNLVLTCVFFVLAIVVGKVVLPRIAKMLLNSNEDMVNIATLDTKEEIMRMSKNKDKPEKKEWF